MRSGISAPIAALISLALLVLILLASIWDTALPVAGETERPLCGLCVRKPAPGWKVQAVGVTFPGDAGWSAAIRDTLALLRPFIHPSAWGSTEVWVRTTLDNMRTEPEPKVGDAETFLSGQRIHLYYDGIQLLAEISS
jgi:hypothetical protein